LRVFARAERKERGTCNLLVSAHRRCPIEPSSIVAWVVANFYLIDRRLSRALAEAAWGLMKADCVSLSAIGRAMRGPLKAAGQIKRLWRLIHNPRFSPPAVQAALIHWIVGTALPPKGGSLRIGVVAMDWVELDFGRIKALRVNLITGSRALPILWYEVLASEMKQHQTELQRRAILDLALHRPPHVKWLVVLDSGFNSSELIDVLNASGAYFEIRTTTKRLVHGLQDCWSAIETLPVSVGQLVDFGWVHHAASNSRAVRLVIARLYDGKKPARKSRRPPKSTYKYSMPGLCAVITNLPEDEFSGVDVIRFYARRFEIEHHFRDLKNASFGMDMEHTHLSRASVYSRLMCIVALAETCLWLGGTEVESRGLHRSLSPCRPKDDRRVISLRNAAKQYLGLIQVPIETLISRHLEPALERAPYVISKSWKDVKDPRQLKARAATPDDLTPLPARCRHRGDGSHRICPRKPVWELVPTHQMPHGEPQMTKAA